MLTLDGKAAILPPFGRLAAIGFAVNAPFIGIALMSGDIKAAVSLFFGYGLAIAIYGMLHAIIARGLGMFTEGDDAKTSEASRTGQSLAFVMLMMSKYVLIGLFLFLAWRTQYMQVLPFIGGFLLAQIAITWVSVAQSKKAKLG
jgi:hypothetical protein